MATLRGSRLAASPAQPSADPAAETSTARGSASPRARVSRAYGAPLAAPPVALQLVQSAPIEAGTRTGAARSCSRFGLPGARRAGHAFTRSTLGHAVARTCGRALAGRRPLSLGPVHRLPVAVAGPMNIMNLLGTITPGTEVKLTVLRDGKRVELSTTPVPR